MSRDWNELILAGLGWPLVEEEDVDTATRRKNGHVVMEREDYELGDATCLRRPPGAAPARADAPLELPEGRGPACTSLSDFRSPAL